MSTTTRVGGTTVTPAGRKKKSVFSSARRGRAGYAFLAPGFILFTAVMVWPTISAFITSLQKWSPVPGAVNQFVGFTNYSKVFHDPVVWHALENSGAYMLVTVIGQMILGLICALALNKAIKGRGAFRAMIYIPVITSWVVVSILFKYLFSGDGGAINWIIKDLGGHQIQWFDSRWPAMAVICILGVWKGVGWTMLIFLAALQAVPNDLHEAAEVDGAGTMERFWHVTLPSIRRTTFFISTMLIIGALNVYISVALITNGGPANATQVPLIYLMQQAFDFLDFGYGSAMAFMLTVIIFAISIGQWAIGERFSKEAAA